MTDIQSKVYSEAHLIQAIRFLIHALTPGPVCYSALCFGSETRGIPLPTLHVAKVELGIEQYHDEYGIAMWRLGR